MKTESKMSPRLLLEWLAGSGGTICWDGKNFGDRSRSAWGFLQRNIEWKISIISNTICPYYGCILYTDIFRWVYTNSCRYGYAPSHKYTQTPSITSPYFISFKALMKNRIFLFIFFHRYHPSPQLIPQLECKVHEGGAFDYLVYGQSPASNTASCT